MSLGGWPLNEIEAGGDLVWIETSRFSYVNDAVLVLIGKNLHQKSSEVSMKTKSPPTSFSFTLAQMGSWCNSSSERFWAYSVHFEGNAITNGINTVHVYWLSQINLIASLKDPWNMIVLATSLTVDLQDITYQLSFLNL